MPTIELLATSAGPAVRVDASGPLIDVCDDARASVEFSCRTASCGTCRLLVIAGGDLLEPARADELELLASLGSSASHRLACQAVVMPGPGLLKLSWVGPG